MQILEEELFLWTKMLCLYHSFETTLWTYLTQKDRKEGKSFFYFISTVEIQPIILNQIFSVDPCISNVLYTKLWVRGFEKITFVFYKCHVAFYSDSYNSIIHHLFLVSVENYTNLVTEPDLG